MSGTGFDSARWPEAVSRATTELVPKPERQTSRVEADDATYLNVTPAQNDGNATYKLTVKDVPVDGFCSISLYNAKGYFEKKSVQRLFAQQRDREKSEDSSIAIGGCDGKLPNCLPIMKGWNYTVRLYRPKAEILDATWTFPEPKPAG